MSKLGDNLDYYSTLRFVKVDDVILLQKEQLVYCARACLPILPKMEAPIPQERQTDSSKLAYLSKGPFPKITSGPKAPCHSIYFFLETTMLLTKVSPNS